MNQRFPLSVRFITAVSSQSSSIACDDGGPERLGYSPQLGAERGGDSDEPDMRIVMRGGRPDDDGATGQVTLERTPPVREVEVFPFPEAPLSDGRYFEDRMARFADDPVYWVPLPAGQTSPPEGLLINDKDDSLMDVRVRRLRHTDTYAPIPPSRTKHRGGIMSEPF